MTRFVKAWPLQQVLNVMHGSILVSLFQEMKKEKRGTDESKSNMQTLLDDNEHTPTALHCTYSPLTHFLLEESRFHLYTAPLFCI